MFLYIFIQECNTIHAIKCPHLCLLKYIFCFPQVSTQSWQLTSIWRGRLATLWSRHICPVSWRSSSPRSPSGSTENLCQPELSLVIFFFVLTPHIIFNRCTKKGNFHDPLFEIETATVCLNSTQQCLSLCTVAPSQSYSTVGNVIQQERNTNQSHTSSIDYRLQHKITWCYRHKTYINVLVNTKGKSFPRPDDSLIKRIHTSNLF